MIVMQVSSEQHTIAGSLTQTHAPFQLLTQPRTSSGAVCRQVGKEHGSADEHGKGHKEKHDKLSESPNSLPAYESEGRHEYKENKNAGEATTRTTGLSRHESEVFG
ncbi:hypothetical protein [Salinibacter ruber]|jgi:hypothetical protein|uniref:hypothetical protein n=1 Tax=Salinibacter ruber TaxID=146919 RepID=UPI002073DE8F|nr:hypothetical protein [Salinibacter ruber]